MFLSPLLSSLSDVGLASYSLNNTQHVSLKLKETTGTGPSLAFLSLSFKYNATEERMG